MKPIISADSHITEPPGTYVDRIDHKFRDRAPHVVRDAKRGDLFVIDGLDKPIPMGLVAAAGKSAEDLKMFGTRFEEMHRGGWDPDARLADQDRDGVSAEILYPTVGMMLCNHPDFDYKKACFDAYNLWIAEYCSHHPDRLIGCGQTAMRSPEEGIEDLRADAVAILVGEPRVGIPAATMHVLELHARDRELLRTLPGRRKQAHHDRPLHAIDDEHVALVRVDHVRRGVFVLVVDTIHVRAGRLGNVRIG